MADLQTPTEASALSSVPVKDAEVQVPTETNGTLADEPPLFPPILISAEVSAALPEGYSMRPLRKSDYYNGERWCDHKVMLADCLPQASSTLSESSRLLANHPSPPFHNATIS